MKSLRPVHLLLLLAMLAPLLLTAAAPLSIPLATTASVARLTVENRTKGDMKLRLDGPGFYYLTIPAGSTEVFTPVRGEYKYTAYACGVKIEGEVDLSSNQKIIQPVCGSGPLPAGRSGDKLDLGQVMKIVKVTITNDAEFSSLLAILTGPQTYVFRFDPEEKKTYTIARGKYDILYYVCGKVDSRTWTAEANSKLTLECP